MEDWRPDHIPGTTLPLVIWIVCVIAFFIVWPLLK